MGGTSSRSVCTHQPFSVERLLNNIAEYSGSEANNFYFWDDFFDSDSFLLLETDMHPKFEVVTAAWEVLKRKKHFFTKWREGIIPRPPILFCCIDEEVQELIGLDVTPEHRIINHEDYIQFFIMTKKVLKARQLRFESPLDIILDFSYINTNDQWPVRFMFFMMISTIPKQYDTFSFWNRYFSTTSKRMLEMQQQDKFDMITQAWEYIRDNSSTLDDWAGGRNNRPSNLGDLLDQEVQNLYGLPQDPNHFIISQGEYAAFLRLKNRLVSEMASK